MRMLIAYVEAIPHRVRFDYDTIRVTITANQLCATPTNEPAKKGNNDDNDRQPTHV